MDAAILARIQYAVTAGFHFLFPPLTIGMVWIIVWMLGRYKKTGLDVYHKMARFWFDLFAIGFAAGVATGITLEFQFGTNWAEYSRFVGDIFGAPLAAESMASFFLESTFMGVLLYGWDRLSKRALWFSALMVAVGASLSALWILVANSWMQTPRGFVLKNGRAELVDFFAAALNPSTGPRFTHSMASSLLTGAFFIMGVSAFWLLRRQHTEIAVRSLKIGLVAGALGWALTLGSGHWHAVQVAQTQPIKLAAFEGLFNTEGPADFLVFGVPDVEAEKTHLPVKVPRLLSLLVHNDLSSPVPGLRDFPRDEWPPVLLTFVSFHGMLLSSGVMLAVLLWGLYLWRKRQLEESVWCLRLMVVAIPAPWIANQLGWITAEVGRQPWAVYGLLKTREAFSFNVPAGQVLTSLLLFTVIYAVLFGLWLYLVRYKVLRGPRA